MKKNFAVYKPSEIELVCNYDYGMIYLYGENDAYVFITSLDYNIP